MSSKAVVDERIVQMKFDNAKFERDVAQSKASMEAFKQTLNFSDSKKSLQEYQKQIKNTDVSGFSGAVDTVKVKLSALNVMAMTMVQDLTRSAVNAGKRIVNALAFDSIKDGYNEYNLKMNSIQTIMMSTGESLKTVNSYLDELNTYSDRTIYSFSDMTENIGKFTNAGVNLKDAVAAIKGVSNEAAISGANANEASRAMYNFAQALSAGYVKLIDWKSIENANMATMDFKNQLIQTAEELGTVVKKGDQYVSMTSNAKGATSDAFDAVRGFNDSLSYQWMTTDVLVKTLSKYTDETTELGRKAYAAASEFKTFSQMWDAWKEAAGSGWANIWQNVFGDFEEAKQLWSMVNYLIGDYITAVFNAKNATLSAWKEGGGRFDLIESALNVFSAVVKVLKAAKDGFRQVFPAKTSKDLIKFTKNLKDLTAKMIINKKDSENLIKTFAGLASILKIVTDITGGVGKVALKVLGDVFGVTFTNVLDLTGALGENITAFQKAIDKYNVFGIATEGVIWGINKVEDAIKFVVDLIRNSDFGVEFFPGLSEGFEQVSLLAGTFGEIAGKHFDALVKKFTEGKKKVTFKDILDEIKSFWSEVLIVFTGATEKADRAVLDVETIKTKILDSFGHMADGVNVLKQSVGDSLGDMISNLINLAKKVPYGNILTIILGATTIKTLWKLANLIDTLNTGFGKLFSLPTRFGDQVVKNLKDFDKLMNALRGDLQAKTIKEIAIAVALFAASMFVVSKIPDADLIKSGVAIGVITAVLTGLVIAIGKANKDGADTAKALRQTALFMVGMAASILLIVNAVKKLSGLDYGDLLPGALTISGLLAVMALVAYALSKSKTEVKSSAAGVAAIIAMALSLKIMVSALKDLFNIDYSNWEAATVAMLAVILGMMGIITALGTANALSGPKGLKGAAVLIGMVIALKGVISLIDDVMKLDVNAILENMGSFILVFSMLGILLAMSGVAGDNAAKAGALMVGIGVAIKLIVDAIQRLGELDSKVLKQGLISVGLLSACFAALIIFSEASGQYAAKAGAMLALAAVAIGILSVCIAMLSQLDPTGLKNATLAIDSMIVCFTLMVAASALAGKAQGVKSNMIAMSSAIAIMAIAIGAISMLDQNGVRTAAAAMSEVMLVFTAFIAVSAIIGKFAPTSAMTLATMGVATLVVGAIALFIGLLAKLPVENVMGVGDALSKVLLSMSAAMVILALIPLPAAISALASLTTFVTGLTLILSILGGLSKIPGFNDLIAGGSGVLSSIGSALGGFVGSIIDGFADKATENMPVFGQRLSAFMTNLQPFIDGAKQLDSSVLDSAKSIVGVVLAITAANVIEGIGRFLTGGSSMDSFGEELYAFGVSFKKYADAIKGIDANAVSASAAAAKALAEFAEAIPEDGGIKQWINGSKDMSEFAEQLIPFGTAFKKYADTVVGVNPNVATASAAAASSLAEFQNKLPNTGGLAQLFTGEKSITDFALQLVPFGIAFKAYSAVISGIDLSVVNASTAAARSLAAFNSELPETGGLKQLFSGKQSMATWGLQLVAFGASFKTYYHFVKGIDMEIVDSSTAAAKSLAAFSNEIPNKGGLKILFTGDSSMQVFGADLAEFGKSFKKYYKQVKGIDMSVVTPSIAAARSIAAFSNNIKNTSAIKSFFVGDNSMATFGSQLVDFGGYFVEYVEEVKGVDSDVVTKVADQLNTMVSSISSISKDSVDAVGDLADTMKNLASVSLSDVASAFDDKKTDFESVGTKIVGWVGSGLKNSSDMESPANSMAKAFVKCLKSAMNGKKADMASGIGGSVTGAIEDVNDDISGYESTLYKTAQSLVQNGVIKGIKDKYNAVKSTGAYIAGGFNTGVKSKKLTLYNTGASMASSVDMGFRKAADIHSPSKVFAKNANYCVLGITNGIKSKLSEIFKAGSDSGKALDDGFRDYLQIHSPGKTGEQSAEYDIDGRLKGAYSMLEDMRKAGSDIGEALDDGFNSTAQNTADTAGAAVDNATKTVKKKGKKTTKAVKKIASDAYITTKATVANAKKMIDKVMDSLNTDKKYKVNQNLFYSYRKMYKAYEGSVKATTEAIYKKSSQCKKDTKVLKDHKKELNKLYKDQNKLRKEIKKTTDTTKKANLKAQLKENTKAISEAKKQIKKDTEAIAKHTQEAFGKNAQKKILNFAKLLYMSSDYYDTDVNNIKQHQKALNDLYKEKAKLENEAAKAKTKSEKKSSAKELKENAKEIEKAKKQLLKDQKTVRSNIKKALQEYRDGIRDTLREYMKISNVSLETGIDAFGEFSDTIDLTKEKLLSNMKSQTKGLADIEEGLTQLAARGLSSGLIAKLRDMGTDAAGYIRVFRSMTNAELKEANKSFAEQSAITKDVIMRNWQMKASDVKEFRNGLKKMLDMGFNVDLVKQIEDMGVESGLAYIRALKGVSSKEKDAINKQFIETYALSESAADSIVASYVKNTKTVGKIINKTTKKTTKTVEEQTPKVSKAVLELQDKIKAAGEAMQEEFEKINATTEELCSSIKSNIESFLSITSLSMDTGISSLFDEFQTEQWDYTLDMFIDNMQSQIDGVKYVQDGLEELSNLNFCDGFIQYLKDLGPQAAQYITEFRTATAEQVQRTNEIFSSYNQLTKEKLLESASSNLEIVKTWSQNMQTLVTNNLNPEILKELAEQGPSGADMVAAYASMTPDEIKQVNEYYKETMSLSDDVSKEISDSYKETAKKTTKDYYETLMDEFQKQIDGENSKSGKKKQTKLTKSMGKLTAGIGKAMQASLTDENLSEVASAGEKVGQSLADGVKKKEGTVKSKGKKVGEAAISGVVKGASDTSQANSAGASIGGALASGISASTDQVVSAAKALVDAANSALSGLSIPDISAASSSSSSSSGGKKGTGTIKSGLGTITNVTKRTAFSAAASKSNKGNTAKTQSANNSMYGSSPTIVFNQTNTSPKALSSAEIYRNSKNLLSQAKGALV